MQSSKQLATVSELERNQLQSQIDALKNQLMEIKQATEAFESQLRAALMEELILERELSALYRQQKKAKKEKRLEQKKRGKNYKEPKGIIRQTKQVVSAENPEETKALKKLYREAMLYIHPDKFTMEDDKQELAHEATTQLIEIYRSGDLKALQAFVAHVMSGNLGEGEDKKISSVQNVDALAHLKKELERLQAAINQAEQRHTYQVLTTYANPSTFIDELRAYYLDRIAKMKRRTRTK